MVADDDFLFDDDELVGGSGQPESKQRLTPWKVLIVDDEQQVHAVTRMVLSDFVFQDRGLEFVGAYSGAEARLKINENPDVGVILLDVVMETESAGLDFARYVRDELGNRHVRIILRTGQPGQAPERRVIVEYDVNDYKEKSELTAQKLFSSMTTALRSYKDIMTIEANRRGLEKIIKGSAELFRSRSMDIFLSGVLQQLGSLLEYDVDGFMLSGRGTSLGERPSPGDLTVVAATDRFATVVGKPASANLDPQIWSTVSNVLQSHESVFETRYSLVYFQSVRYRDTLVYLETKRGFHPFDHGLIKLLCANASVGLDHVVTA